MKSATLEPGCRSLISQGAMPEVTFDPGALGTYDSCHNVLITSLKRRRMAVKTLTGAIDSLWFYTDYVVSGHKHALKGHFW